MTDTENNNSNADATKIASELETERGRARRFEAQLADVEKKLESFNGVDLEALKARAEELEILKKETATKSPKDLEAWQSEKEKELEGKVRSDLQKTIDELEGKVTGLSKTNRELSIVDKAMEIAAPHFNDDIHIFIKDKIRKHVDRDEKGNYIVKDDEGNTRIKAGQANVNMDIKDFIGELRESYPSLAKGEVQAGSKQSGEKRSDVSGLSIAGFLSMTPEQRKAIDPEKRGKAAMEAAKGISLSTFKQG